MKKMIIAILSLIAIIPLSVNAEKVTTLDTKVEEKTIKYNGAVEDGITAVMCHLLDTNGKSLDNMSLPVNSNKFNGEFQVSKDGTYKVSCAKYEGGETKVAEVTVGNTNSESSQATKAQETSQTNEEEKQNETKDKRNANNIKTGDNIKVYFVLAVVSVAGFIALIIYLKKKQKC